VQHSRSSELVDGLMRRRISILAILLAVTAVTVTAGVAGSDTGPPSPPLSPKGEGPPNPPPEPPALSYDGDQGKDIILDSNSPEVKAEDESGKRYEDKLLDEEHFDENSKRAVHPDEQGDDAESCAIASAAKASRDRGQASRAEFEAEMDKAKAESASSTMRDALDKALAGGELPTCPPPGRP